MRFFSSLLLLGSIALASPAPRAPSSSLRVALSAPLSVDSVSDIKITAAVTNTGHEDVTVLRYGTVLDDKSFTKAFHVSKNGESAKFTGLKINVDLDYVQPSQSVTIPAGKTITVSHDLGSLYDFKSLGAGAYTFEAVDRFHFVGGRTHSLTVKVDSASVKINVGRTVSVRESEFDKRAVVNCSDPTKAAQIQASYTEGQQLAQQAIDYINANGADALFKSYYGNNTVASVIAILQAVVDENSKTRTLNCADPYGECTGGTIAYTVVSTTNIYYCPSFFTEVSTANLCNGTTVASRNIRGGTTLHELTHATKDTDDVAYGCANDMKLSPADQLRNADNYNCFATQVYANTKCKPATTTPPTTTPPTTTPPTTTPPTTTPPTTTPPTTSPPTTSPTPPTTSPTPPTTSPKPPTTTPPTLTPTTASPTIISTLAPF